MTIKTVNAERSEFHGDTLEQDISGITASAANHWRIEAVSKRSNREWQMASPDWMDVKSV
jgi:hypothetical protein